MLSFAEGPKTLGPLLKASERGRGYAAGAGALNVRGFSTNIVDKIIIHGG